MGDNAAINLNKTLCQVDDLKYWKGSKPNQSERETGGRKERSLGFCILSCPPYPSPCSDIYPAGLFDLITAPGENEESELSQEPTFITNFQYLLDEEISYRNKACRPNSAMLLYLSRLHLNSSAQESF